LGTEFAVLVLLIFVGGAIYYYYFSKQEPSMIVGYRTKQSRSTTAKWRASQKWFYQGAITCAAVVVVVNLVTPFSIGVNLVVLLVYLFVISYFIERRLREMGD